MNKKLNILVVKGANSYGQCLIKDHKKVIENLREKDSCDWIPVITDLKFQEDLKPDERFNPCIRSEHSVWLVKEPYKIVTVDLEIVKIFTKAIANKTFELARFNSAF